MLAGELDDPLEEAVGDDRAGRVVRVVEEDQARAAQVLGGRSRRGRGRSRAPARSGSTHRLGAGEQRPAGVDRIAGVGGERDVARIEEGEAEVVDALLGADRRDHLGLGVDLDPEAAVVEAGEGLAELRPAAVRRVLVGARVGDRRLHRLDDVRIGRHVGVADPEADHVDPGLLLRRDLALELGEHVRRDRLEALGGVGERHRAQEATRARDTAASTCPADRERAADPVRGRRRRRPRRRRRTRAERAPRPTSTTRRRSSGRARSGSRSWSGWRPPRSATCGCAWGRRGPASTRAPGSAAIAAVLAIYAITALVHDEPEGPATTLIVMLAVLVACWLGGGRPAIICGLAAAIVGPAGRDPDRRARPGRVRAHRRLAVRRRALAPGALLRLRRRRRPAGGAAGRQALRRVAVVLISRCQPDLVANSSRKASNPPSPAGRGRIAGEEALEELRRPQRRRDPPAHRWQGRRRSSCAGTRPAPRTVRRSRSGADAVDTRARRRPRGPRTLAPGIG